MSVVYSKRLGVVKSTTSVTTVVVPTGTVWVLRSIDMVCEDTSGASAAGVRGNLGQWITVVNEGAGNNLIAYHWDGRQVLYAGESFQMVGSVKPWSITVSGYEFTAP